MILGFYPQFKEKILDGTKKHTLRADETDRWKVGRSIQFATGVRTKEYNKFKDGKCVEIAEVSLWLGTRAIFIRLLTPVEESPICKLYKGAFLGDAAILDPFGMNENPYADFIRNDGFDSEDDFWLFFKAQAKDFDEVVYKKLILW